MIAFALASRFLIVPTTLAAWAKAGVRIATKATRNAVERKLYPPRTVALALSCSHAYPALRRKLGATLGAPLSRAHGRPLQCLGAALNVIPAARSMA